MNDKERLRRKYKKPEIEEYGIDKEFSIIMSSSGEPMVEGEIESSSVTRSSPFEDNNPFAENIFEDEKE